MLISEDLRCSPEKAYEIMLESANVGSAMNALKDNDEELEYIHNRNVRLGKEEKAKVRHENLDDVRNFIYYSFMHVFQAILKAKGLKEPERRFEANGRPLPRPLPRMAKVSLALSC